MNCPNCNLESTTSYLMTPMWYRGIAPCRRCIDIAVAANGSEGLEQLYRDCMLKTATQSDSD